MTRQLIKLLFLALVVGGGSVGLWQYEKYRARDLELEKKEQERLKLVAENEALQGYIKNLTDEQRVAEILVTNQVRHGEAVDSTTLMFKEYSRPDSTGRRIEIPPRFFTVQGDGAHIDALVIKFEREDVERNDPLRGHSLVLFYRLFGDHQTPADAYMIDPPGQIPQVYTAPGNSPENVRGYQRELWENIWKLASDEAYRKKMGVRVLSKESPWDTFEPNRLYTITLSASEGLTLRSGPIDSRWQEYREAVGRAK